MANSNAADGELQRKIDEYKARERVYLAGLLGQEAETGHLRQMAVDVLSTYGDVSKAAVRGALVYPTANMEVLLLRQKLCEKDKQINLLKEELEANRFDQRMPDGQALMRKCKALLTENRELGEEIREERIAELRAALQTEQRQNGQLYQKVQEASDFCKELSEENEKLQGTIARVAGRLRESRSELEGEGDRHPWVRERLGLPPVLWNWVLAGPRQCLDRGLGPLVARRFHLHENPECLLPLPRPDAAKEERAVRGGVRHTDRIYAARVRFGCTARRSAC